MASSCWINLNDGMTWANLSGALSEPLPTSSDGSPVVADRADLSSLPGTIHIGDAVFYADANGAVSVTSGWIMSNGASGESDNAWYYASSNGALKSGWQYVNGAWYWMDPSTFKMKTGWLNDGGTWYWLKPSGAMFANGWLKIDGVDYYFNASGAWLNTPGSVLGVNRSRLVSWLMSHENDGYHRGTRYDTQKHACIQRVILVGTGIPVYRYELRRICIACIYESGREFSSHCRRAEPFSLEWRSRKGRLRKRLSLVRLRYRYVRERDLFQLY